MSKRTKKSKANPADATAQPPPDPSSVEPPPVSAQASNQATSSETPAPVHSMAPTTDDIDDDWGNSVAPAAQVAAGAANAAAASSETSTSAAPLAVNLIAEAAPSAPSTTSAAASASTESSAADTGEPTMGATPDAVVTQKAPDETKRDETKRDETKRDETKTAQRTAAIGSSTIRPPPPSTKSMPPVGVAAANGDTPVRPSTAPRSLTPSSGMASVVLPPPSTRKVTPAVLAPVVAGEVLPRPSAVPRPSAQPEKSTPPSSAIAREAAQKDESGSPVPPVVRAVVLPPLVDVPLPARGTKGASEPQRKAELELAPVPVPRAAAAAIVEPPAPLELELSEVEPGDSTEDATDVAPPPPGFLMESLANADDELAGVPEEELDALSAEDSGLSTGIPSSGEVTVTEVTAPLTDLPTESETAPAPVVASGSEPPKSAAPTEPVIPLLTDLGPSKPVSILPTVPVEPMTADEFAPLQRKWRSRAPMVLLWLFTAIAPATTVWWFMRVPPRGDVAKCSELPGNNPMQAERVIARAAMPESLGPAAASGANAAQMDDAGVALATSATAPLDSASPQSEPVASGEMPPDRLPSSTAVVPNDQPPPAGSAADPAASASTASAESVPTDKLPVVVETDSKDRVSVVLKTEPMGARVLRMDKEIGRTPLMIQIGRGERRVFVLSASGFGYKRMTLDDSKPELLVDLSSEGKDGTEAKEGKDSKDSKDSTEAKASRVPKAVPRQRTDTKAMPPPGHAPPTASFE